MSTSGSRAKWLTQWIVGYMSLGPLAVGLDLALHLFPSTPTIQLMRNSSFYVHSLWLGCGLLGIITVALLRARPLFGYMALVALTAAYAPVSHAVWHQSVMLHYWLPLAAMALGTYGVFVGRHHEPAVAD
jgi:hypothetical protein